MKKRSRILSFILFWLARGLLSLRYDVSIKGREKISFKKSILFLPNHPAEIDPILLMVYLGPSFFQRPMVVEHFYRIKGFQWILDLIGVIPIPTMEEKANIWRGKEVAKIFSDVSDAIRIGDNFMIYPAGKLKGSGRESLGGASFVHSLIQAFPEVNVVLVRTTGLWGSCFSKAVNGKSPDFAKTLFSRISCVLKNGIFFIPKRKVLIEIEEAPMDLPRQASRLIFNKYLEDWYNQYPQIGPEPLTLVSYSRFKDEFCSMQNAISSGEGDAVASLLSIPLDIETRIKNEVAALAKVDPSVISRKTHLSNDLGLDSLDIANIYIFLDRTFDVIDFNPGDLQSFEDLLLAVSGVLKAKTNEESSYLKSFRWPAEPFRKKIRLPEGKTIPEAFLRCCDYMGSAAVAADRSTGVISYKKMKLASLALSQKIEQLPGDRVGVLLPASVGAYITILAVMLANKIPVMMNWTAGIRGLDHASETTEIQHVLTAQLFLDKANLSNLGKIESKIVYLEQLKRSLTFREKALAWMRSKKKALTLMKELKINLKPASDMAVILFTSGTESLPKAVPLSHENILFNQSAAASCIKFKRKDCFFGILPPFHSFGFSITGLMPILMGCRVFYSPDPNNSRRLAAEIKAAAITILCSAPSFIRAIFAVAEPSDIKSLRLIVSGAEKAVHIQDYISLNLPEAAFLEGYGITECSPVVTLTPVGKPIRGVGRPLPGIEILCINSITKEVLPKGEEGEICIRAPSVFYGYLNGSKVSNPFIEIEGDRWYLSGDRGYLDPSGSLHLTGRLKRFVKVGGEMVSLGGLEEEIFYFALSKGLCSQGSSNMPLALCAKQNDIDKTELILFATFPILKEEINAHFKIAGWARIIKISQVIQIDQIPLTGVGKTDYRLLAETYLSS